MSTLITLTPRPISVDLNIVIDASGNVDVFNAAAPQVQNVIVAEHMLPVSALYDPDTMIGLLELWEPSEIGHQGDIYVQLANTDCSESGGLVLTNVYQQSAKSLASGLQAILCDSFDCSGASPFNGYTNNVEYYKQRDFGRVALATYAHYMFGHVDATAAITNDKAFVEGMLSLDSAGDSEDAATRAGSYHEAKIDDLVNDVQSWSTASSGTDANLAIRLIKALVAKGLDTNGIPIISSINEPDQDKLRASLANIVAQVVGQDASRLMNVDNSQRTRDQHILLRFYEGDVIYMNITLKTPSISVGLRNQLVSGSTLQSMYTEENFTLKITLGQPETSNILYTDLTKTVVTGYNGIVIGELNIPAPTEVIETGSFVDQFLMTSLSLPYTLRMIEPSAFVNCTALDTITYPDGAEGVYTSGFIGCELLEPSLFQIDPNEPQITVPDAPTNIMATVGNSEAIVSFTAPTNNGGATITSYTVTSSPGSLQATGSSSPITVTGLTNGTTYTFTVTATNSAGGSPTSPTSPSVTPVTIPEAPTSVTATVGNSEAIVSFTAPTNDGGATITSYTVTSSPGGLTATGSSPPITVTGLTNGTAYTFTVEATNSAGCSPTSPTSPSVTPVAPVTVPDSPTDVTATVGNGQAIVSFKANSFLKLSISF